MNKGYYFIYVGNIEKQFFKNYSKPEYCVNFENVGFYENMFDAVKAIENNYADIHENNNTYAIILKKEARLYNCVPLKSAMWFKWCTKTDKYVQIDLLEIPEDIWSDAL